LGHRHWARRSSSDHWECIQDEPLDIAAACAGCDCQQVPAPTVHATATNKPEVVQSRAACQPEHVCSFVGAYSASRSSYGRALQARRAVAHRRRAELQFLGPAHNLPDRCESMCVESLAASRLRGGGFFVPYIATRCRAGRGTYRLLCEWQTRVTELRTLLFPCFPQQKTYCTLWVSSADAQSFGCEQFLRETTHVHRVAYTALRRNLISHLLISMAVRLRSYLYMDLRASSSGCAAEVAVHTYVQRGHSAEVDACQHASAPALRLSCGEDHA
jgi:hypothetical protein